MWSKLLRNNANWRRVILNKGPNTSRTVTNTPNVERIVKSAAKHVTVTDENICEYIFTRFAHFSNSTAITCSMSKRSYTYGEIVKSSRNLAANLRNKLHLRDDDVVTMLLPNIPESPAVSLGVIQANCVLSAVNPMLTPAELSKTFTTTNPSCVVTIPQLIDTVKRALKIAEINIPILVVDLITGKSHAYNEPDVYDAFEFLTNADTDVLNKLPDRKMNDIVALFSSSGTTGLAKSVAVTKRNLVYGIKMVESEYFRLDGNREVVPSVLPFFHVYGFIITQLNMLLRGATLVTMPKFKPDLYISLLKEYKPTYTLNVPPLIMLKVKNPAILQKDLSRMRYALSAAAPLSLNDIEKFKEKFPWVKFGQGYGLSEATSMVCTTPHMETLSSPLSVGKLLPNTEAKCIHIETSQVLGPYQRGEILIKGPQVMSGYYKNDVESRAAFTDGWLKTGDIGYFNDNKELFIVDRIKELIKVKGFQVAPVELEELLKTHPNVTDAAVVGVEHNECGEIPMAFVVRHRNVSEDELQAYVSSKVVAYKQLRGGVKFIDSVPRNPAGKILRRELKERIATRVV